MPSIMPGPSSTLMGAPVVTTSAPGPRPEVSSYTWMEAASPVMFRISPMRRCSPTRTTSDILASARPVATTSGPDTFTILPLKLAQPSFKPVSPEGIGPPGKRARKIPWFFRFFRRQAEEEFPIIFGRACTCRKYPDPCVLGTHTPVTDVTGGGGCKGGSLLPLYRISAPTAL